MLLAASPTPIRTVLELGSGGGNNASHLKASLELTLIDISLGMLDLSKTINPECEHILGDMRTVRLQRDFDAVLVHDAVMHLTTKDDLREGMRTAFAHCKPGGVALFLPDFIRETFQPCVHHGGHDADDRALRYFEWTFDPNPSDTTYTVDFVFMLREGKNPVRVEHDCHVYGLFSRVQWLELFAEVGFNARAAVDPYGREIFIGAREKVG